MRRAVFEDAVAVIEADYASDLTPQVVARRIGTSRRQLQRVFAEVGHTTFAEHLTNVRLDRAADLLAREPRPVAEVARAVGYRSTSAFSVAFRRRHGVPPGAARRIRTRRAPSDADHRV